MATKKNQKSKCVSVLSDGTAATADQIVRATLAQFRKAKVRVHVRPGIASVEQVRDAVKEAKKFNGLIAYTLVLPELRSEIVSLANEAGILAVDLLGPLMSSLSELLTSEPAHEAGLFTTAGKEHYARLEAMSFTVRHDDGLNLAEISQADLVLIGPSRTSKTPLSVYIAHTRGLRVANIPLVLGVEPSSRIAKLPRGRLAGLTMRAPVLASVRRQRLKELGADDIEYAQLAYVERELRHCHEIYRGFPMCPVIDVTEKSIEEIAAEVCARSVDRSLRHADP